MTIVKSKLAHRIDEFPYNTVKELFPAKPGVYCIMNIVSRRCYIGSADNLRKRCGQHVRQIGRGFCDNMLLRLDVVKFGAHNFRVFPIAVFDSLEEAKKYGGLERAEVRWTLHFKADNEWTGYNLKLGSCFTYASRFRDRERKLLRYKSYFLLKGVDLYDPINEQLLNTWEPEFNR